MHIYIEIKNATIITPSILGGGLSSTVYKPTNRDAYRHGERRLAGYQALAVYLFCGAINETSPNPRGCDSGVDMF